MVKTQEESGFDIFLSYASEDRERARQLAEMLKSQGWKVFWDRTIPAGKTWRQVIGGALESARCVVVIWSNASVKSRWVQEEADCGLEREILVPVLIDDVKPPLGFGAIQAIDLTNWDFTRPLPAFDKFIVDLTTLLGPSPKSVQEEERQKAEKEQLAVKARRSAEEESEQPLGKAPEETEESLRQVELQAVRDAYQPSTETTEPKKSAPLTLWFMGVVVALIGIGVGFFQLNNQREPVVTQTEEQEPNYITQQETNRILEQREILEKARHEAERRLQQRDAEIAKLLDLGKQAEAELRLTTPKYDNAADYYRRILQLEHENSEAQKGLQRVTDTYLAWAEEGLTKRRFNKVKENLEKAFSVDPDHPGIRQLQGRLANLEQEQAELEIRRKAVDAKSVADTAPGTPRGWLGVLIQDVTNELAESFGLPQTHGALVAQVIPDSPAKMAGLQVGDVILEFNGAEVTNANALPPLVASSLIGQTTEVSIIRKGRRRTLEVVIVELPKDVVTAKSQENNRISVGSPTPSSVREDRLGVTARELSVEEKERIGLDSTEGAVLVEEINEGVAQEAGIRKGDLIQEINRRRLKGINDFQQQIKELPSGKSVAILIYRNNSSVFLVLRLPGNG